MRDAYHEELDSIADSLVEMTRLVGSAMARARCGLVAKAISCGTCAAARRAGSSAQALGR